MPEPSHRQPRQEHSRAFAIRLHDVRTGPPYVGILTRGEGFAHPRGSVTQANIAVTPAGVTEFDISPISLGDQEGGGAPSGGAPSQGNVRLNYVQFL